MTGPGDQDEQLDFDPYRFGAPEHPVPPEYAPPGYRPPAPPPVAGPPQFPSYPPPPPYAPYGAPRASNTKAVLALVFGVLAIVLSFLSLYDLLLAIPAIVLGTMARSDATRFPERGGRGMATAGLVCGIAGIVLAALATIWIYHRIKPCMDDFGSTGKDFQKCATDRLLGNR